MKIPYRKGTISFPAKHLTTLDRFVLDFTGVLSPHTPYVIVSGYVAILFGRSRGTEDIVILIPRIHAPEFLRIHTDLIQNGYEFLNAVNCSELYDMLEHRMGIRIARKERFIPNIELKFLKDAIDRQVLKKKVRVDLAGGSLYISPIEIQIPYKLFLGSPKDIEDAVYLFEIFSDQLDTHLLTSIMKTFDIKGAEYGIDV